MYVNLERWKTRIESNRIEYFHILWRPLLSFPKSFFKRLINQLSVQFSAKGHCKPASESSFHFTGVDMGWRDRVSVVLLICCLAIHEWFEETEERYDANSTVCKEKHVFLHFMSLYCIASNHSQFHRCFL